MTLGAWLVLAAAFTVVAISGILVWSHWRFARYHRHKGHVRPPLGLGGFVRMHMREAWAWLVLAWWTVRGAFRDGWRVPARIAGAPVVCVHGFTQNGTNFWGIRRRLGRGGRPTRALYMGRPFKSLAGYVPKLERVLDEAVARFPDRRLDVVCHSMGGVILRLLLVRRPDLACRLGRLVTLGSPHQGTAAPRGFALSADVRQLSRSSKVLRELPTFEVLAPHADVTTIAGVRDLVVYPHDSSLLPEAEHVVLADVGHAGLLVHREAIEAVVRALRGSESASLATA